MSDLTWRRIKANPIRAIREIRFIEKLADEARRRAMEAERKFIEVRDRLQDEGLLEQQITRLQSEVYDLKKRARL